MLATISDYLPNRENLLLYISCVKNTFYVLMFQMIITTEMADRVEKHVSFNFYMKLEKTVPETDKTFKTDLKQKFSALQHV
jgi:hypothetical protein